MGTGGTYVRCEKSQSTEDSHRLARARTTAFDSICERATTGLSGGKGAHEASGTHPQEGELAATAPSELPAEGPKGNSNPETLVPGRE